MKIGRILGGVDLSECERCHALVLTANEDQHRWWHDGLDDALQPEYAGE